MDYYTAFIKKAIATGHLPLYPVGAWQAEPKKFYRSRDSDGVSLVFRISDLRRILPNKNRFNSRLSHPGKVSTGDRERAVRDRLAKKLAARKGRN